MKVGILSFHHTSNYGATLQNYALWKTIDNLGFKAEVIDYQPFVAMKNYYVRELLPSRPVLSNLAKILKMKQFRESRIQLSEGVYFSSEGLKRFKRCYDAVVVGSDQVWSTDGWRGYDPSFFLDFIDGETTLKISYAASAGHTETLGAHRSNVQSLVRQFQAISVRDANTARVIKEECALDSIQVLDPTFLVGYGEFLGKALAIDSPFLLIYKMGPMSSSEESFILRLAGERNLKIVSVGYHHRIAQYNLAGIGPEEWVRYYSQAAYVFTDSYHGSIFSIIFHKPFNVFVCKTKAAKTGDLLNKLGLIERIFDGDKTNTSNIDYAPVQERLTRRVQASRDFLIRALSSRLATAKSSG
ncbi:polysaccharide pyruvyl transferase family protein [Gloeobacter violaceus]|uniref:Gll1779 protein n=1 Tax=Gloeobacter violaceus (strain ATCC 29082 / PCC 7421) TaxID=251221 RepID=Q7NJQ3_GLOVI|nr:polysaccharide pyruvyl transferase family protein [Gloeobacter violaceus]BAC89720.1 gll1779 [Gloeobacter violaceus PCC 7421]